MTFTQLEHLGEDAHVLKLNVAGTLTRPRHTIMIRPDANRGAADIRGLLAILKRLLRDYGSATLSVKSTAEILILASVSTKSFKLKAWHLESSVLLYLYRELRRLLYAALLNHLKNQDLTRSVAKSRVARLEEL